MILPFCVCGASLAILSLPIHADTFGSGTNQFTIHFVTVGDPGNPDDIGSTGLYSMLNGGVPYEFRIAAYEVSRNMIFQANREGHLGITIYNFDTAGIGVGKGDDRPATSVSWNEAARFVNYRNESEGYSHAYKFSLQPGDSGYRAYLNIQLWTAGDVGYDPSNPYRNSNAHYSLPSDDEWYKAAYYSGSGIIYHDFATGSDTIPIAVAGGTASGTAVYDQINATGPAEIDNAEGLSHLRYYGPKWQRL